MGPSPPTWQRPAPGRRADGSKIREARCDRCRRSASNGCGVRRPPRGTWPAPCSQDQPAAACSGAQNRRHAGAARQPRGPLRVPGGPQVGPQQARPGLLGPEVNRPPGRREAPAYPSAPRAPPPGLAAGKKRRVPELRVVPFSLILRADAATFAAHGHHPRQAPAPSREGPQARHAGARASRTGSG